MSKKFESGAQKRQIKKRLFDLAAEQQPLASPGNEVRGRNINFSSPARDLFGFETVLICLREF